MIAGSSDLLPMARNIPTGKQKINAKAETIKVKDNPPHAPVSIHLRPKTPPDIKFNAIIGYIKRR